MSAENFDRAANAIVVSFVVEVGANRRDVSASELAGLASLLQATKADIARP